jgi:pyruvate/2-oxoglutarate dehydrogenase complex dihydrolipoamide dehydrogenase (E3) component
VSQRVSGKSVSVTVDTSSGRRTIAGTHILVAAGRLPNTHDLGLEEAGVHVTERGFR